MSHYPEIGKEYASLHPAGDAEPELLGAIPVWCIYCGEAIVVCKKTLTVNGIAVWAHGATDTGYRHVVGPDSPRDHGAYPGDAANRRVRGD